MRWNGPQGFFARDPVMSSASLAVVIVFALVLIVHLVRGN